MKKRITRKQVKVAIDANAPEGVDVSKSLKGIKKPPTKIVKRRS
jgi:hypothetical protein